MIVAFRGLRLVAWPEKTVRIVTPFSPGVSPDVAARVLADGLTKVWKQSVVVENRPGADTTLGTQVFLDSRDGRTLLFTTHSTSRGPPRGGSRRRPR
jgi:tripartite-type tricarboxylate transporter receptor subunit TctC